MASTAVSGGIARSRDYIPPPRCVHAWIRSQARIGSGHEYVRKHETDDGSYAEQKLLQHRPMASTLSTCPLQAKSRLSCSASTKIRFLTKSLRLQRCFGENGLAPSGTSLMRRSLVQGNDSRDEQVQAPVVLPESACLRTAMRSDAVKANSLQPTSLQPQLRVPPSKTKTLCSFRRCCHLVRLRCCRLEAQWELGQVPTFASVKYDEAVRMWPV